MLCEGLVSDDDDAADEATDGDKEADPEETALLDVEGSLLDVLPPSDGGEVGGDCIELKKADRAELRSVEVDIALSLFSVI